MAHPGNLANELALQRKTGVIAGDSNVHFRALRAAATTPSTVIPNPLNAASAGADAPNPDIPTNSPFSVKYRSHPNLTPASIPTRARTEGRIIESRYS